MKSGFRRKLFYQLKFKQLNEVYYKVLTPALYFFPIFQIERNLRYLHSNREELAKEIAIHA